MKKAPNNLPAAGALGEQLMLLMAFAVSAAAEWLEELQRLAVRFSSHGIGTDLASLTLAQGWGVLLFLRLLAVGGADVG